MERKIAVVAVKNRPCGLRSKKGIAEPFETH